MTQLIIGGTFMKILRVNMATLETGLEDLPEEWKIIGGKGLIAKIMNKELSPDADPHGIHRSR